MTHAGLQLLSAALQLRVLHGRVVTQNALHHAVGVEELEEAVRGGRLQVVLQLLEDDALHAQNVVDGAAALADAREVFSLDG